MLIGAKEVCEILKVKNSMAYLIIKNLNDELKTKGYLIVRGKINEDYLLERYGLKGEVN